MNPQTTSPFRPATDRARSCLRQFVRVRRATRAGLTAAVVLLPIIHSAAADIAGNHITYVTPQIAGFTITSASINHASSGEGHVATGAGSVNGDVFNYIIKLSPGGAPAWSLQGNDPDGGAFLRHVPGDRVVMATHDGQTDTTEFSQFVPNPDGGDPVLEFALEAVGNQRLSGAFRFLDGGVFSLSTADGTAQLTRHGASGELELARTYRLEMIDEAEAIPISDVRLHDARGGFLMTFQSPGTAENRVGQHFAKIDRTDLSLKWTTHHDVEAGDASVFLSSQTKAGANMFFANNAGLDPAEQFRIARVDQRDGGITGGVVNGAGRNPPAALFAEDGTVVAMGYRQQAGGDGRYLTLVRADADLTTFTGFELYVLNGGMHTYAAAGFSYPGRFNLEFQTQIPGIGGSGQSWVGVLDIGAEEEGFYWVNQTGGAGKFGGYRFTSGEVPFYQYRDTVANRLELGHVHERLGVGTDRFELPAFNYNTLPMSLGFEEIHWAALEGVALHAEPVGGDFIPPLSLKAEPQNWMTPFGVDASYSNVGTTPEVTVQEVEFEDADEGPRLTSTLALSQPATVLLGQKSAVDRSTRLVAQRTLLGDVPGLSQMFEFREGSSSGFGLHVILQPGTLDPEP